MASNSMNDMFGIRIVVSPKCDSARYGGTGSRITIPRPTTSRAMRVRPEWSTNMSAPGIGAKTRIKARKHVSVTRNAIPPRRGTHMSAWGNAPGINAPGIESKQERKPKSTSASRAMRFRPEWGINMSAWGIAPGNRSKQGPKPQRGDTNFAAMIRKNFGTGELNERTEQSNMARCLNAIWYRPFRAQRTWRHCNPGRCPGLACGWAVGPERRCHAQCHSAPNGAPTCQPGASPQESERCTNQSPEGATQPKQ